MSYRMWVTIEAFVSTASCVVTTTGLTPIAGFTPAQLDTYVDIRGLYVWIAGERKHALQIGLDDVCRL